MDCAYKGRVAGHGVTGRKEILAASSHRRTMLGQLQLSFSEAMSSALAQLRDTEFTTRDLYDNLCAFEPEDEPLHITLSSHKNDPILLSTSALSRIPSEAGPAQEPEMEINIHLRNAPRAPGGFAGVGAWIQQHMGIHWRRDRPDIGPAGPLSFTTKAPSLADDPQAWGDMARTASSPVREILVDSKLELTHPRRQKASEASGHISIIDELVQSLNINQEIRINLARHGLYTNVAVLPIIFETVEPEHNLFNELEDLRRCFEDYFRFEVSPTFKIPRRGIAQDALAHRVKEMLLKNGKKDELIIIVYAGHGVDTSTMDTHIGPAVWAP
jgi:hypothetical protein